MAYRKDDVERVIAVCRNCGSGYAARRWPDGEVQPIGSEGCNCGSTELIAVDEDAGGDSNTTTDPV
ncbi:hypothetical protein NGM15_01565 [Natronosalvus halobius]|nr:hypothetical protein NGM15_01565 [Natronosalvus halobius]